MKINMAYVICNPVIPGIIVEEVQKASKTFPEQEEEEGWKGKTRQEEKDQNDSSKMSSNDFFKTPLKTKVDIRGFEFSEYSDDSDASEAFKDSRELQSEY